MKPKQVLKAYLKAMEIVAIFMVAVACVYASIDLMIAGADKIDSCYYFNCEITEFDYLKASFDLLGILFIWVTMVKIVKNSKLFEDDKQTKLTDTVLQEKTG